MTAHTGTQSIERGAQLLVHVVEEDEAPTVGELARLAGLPKSTTSRLVGALERQGLVQRDPEGGAIRPGPVLLRFAHRETSALDLVELAGGALERLARASGETANLGVATSTAAEMLDQRDSRHILGSTNWVGQRVPHHGSVIGKVFLADGAVPLPDGSLERLAPRTITDLAELRRDLDRTRARGYATAVDELEPGLWAVGAPVRDAVGTVDRSTQRLGADRAAARRSPRRARWARAGRGLYPVQKNRLRRPETRSCMSEEEIDLNALTDEDLVTQMHDDLYDGLAPEIAEGTNILLGRGWAPDTRAERGSRRRNANRRDRLPRRHPLRARGAPRSERDEGGHGDPAAAARRDRRGADRERSSSGPSRADSTTSARTSSS